MVTAFGSYPEPQCVELVPDRFSKRLFELSRLEADDICFGLESALKDSVCRAVKVRDHRNEVTINPAFSDKLSDLLHRMALHGARRFLVEGGLYPNFGGSYRLKGGSLRPAFVEAKPSEYWQWSNADWNNLLAMDWLEDYAESIDLTALAMEAALLLERDIQVRNVIFDAELGLVVQHQGIDDFMASILYQAPEQIAKIRSTDLNRMPDLSVAAVD